MSALRGKADLNQAMTPASPYDPDPRERADCHRFLVLRRAERHWFLPPAPLDGRPSLRIEAEARPPDCPLGPAEARENGAAHDPIFVLLRQERQLLGEMGNALLVGGLDEAIGDIGPPIATLRTVCVKQPADVGGELTKRIGFGRIVGSC